MKTKIWRIGIRIFGDSDVVNKLYEVKTNRKFAGKKIVNREKKNICF